MLEEREGEGEKRAAASEKDRKRERKGRNPQFCPSCSFCLGNAV